MEGLVDELTPMLMHSNACAVHLPKSVTHKVRLLSQHKTMEQCVLRQTVMRARMYTSEADGRSASLQYFILNISSYIYIFIQVYTETTP